MVKNPPAMKRPKHSTVNQQYFSVARMVKNLPTMQEPWI